MVLAAPVGSCSVSVAQAAPAAADSVASMVELAGQAERVAPAARAACWALQVPAAPVGQAEKAAGEALAEPAGQAAKEVPAGPAANVACSVSMETVEPAVTAALVASAEPVVPGSMRAAPLAEQVGPGGLAGSVESPVAALAHTPERSVPVAWGEQVALADSAELA